MNYSHGSPNTGSPEYLKLLGGVLSQEMLNRLASVKDPELHRWLYEVLSIAKPSSVYVLTGSEEDLEYVKRVALERVEELPTRYPKHTVHFDGPKDLARDRKNTRILLPGGGSIPLINTYDREAGVREVLDIARGIMEGKEVFVAFYCF